MSRFSLQQIDCADHPELPVVRSLLTQYQQSLGIDLCFQNFSQELAQLPGAYLPPDGYLALAWSNSAHVGRQAAGCIALRRHDAQSAEMKRLYVRPEFQGQGLGRQLAEHIIALARQKGYRRIVLDTLPSMQSAQALYGKLGFCEVPAYGYNPVVGTKYLALQWHP